MKIKVILFCVATTFANYSFGQKSVKLNSEIDSLYKVQKTVDLKQDYKVVRIYNAQKSIDSKQDNQIKTVQEFENSYKIKESLFSNQLTILTGIFSAIVAIAIFIIGYLIPKENDEKHKKELNELLSEFETIRDEIKISREETKKIEAKNNFNNSKLMFYSCYDKGDNKHGELLWALRYCKDNFICFNNPTDEDVITFIDVAVDLIPEIAEERGLKDFVDEVNTLTNELTEMYKIEGLKDKLIMIKEGYNKLVWSDKKEDEKQV